MEFTDLGLSKILIVDDQDLNFRLMETLLQSEGYSTVSASNGRVALAMAVVEKPDLILLDIMMPDMDGFETVKYLKADLITLDIHLPGMDGWQCLERLKKNTDVASIPVVIISIVADRARGLSLGANQVLQKPVTP